MSTHYTHRDSEFMPVAQDGWSVHECWIDDDGPNLQVHPLAGWLVQVETQMHGGDVVDKDNHHDRTRTFLPAVWTECQGLCSIEELVAQNSVAQLVGPGQDAPNMEHLATEAREKFARYKKRAAQGQA